MANGSEVLLQVGKKSWTKLEVAQYLASRPDAMAQYTASIKRGASQAAAFEAIISTGKDAPVGVEATPALDNKVKRTTKSKTKPAPTATAESAPATATKPKKSVSVGNTEIGIRVVAKVFRAAKDIAGDGWKTLTPEQKAGIILRSPDVAALKGNAAVGVIRGLATRVGTVRGGAAILPMLETWGKEHGVSSVSSEFAGATGQHADLTTGAGSVGKTPLERSAARKSTAAIASRRGKGAVGGSSEGRLTTARVDEAKVAAPSVIDDITRMVKEQTDMIAQTRDREATLTPAGTTKAGVDDILSSLGGQQNKQWTTDTIYKAWRTYNDGLPSGAIRVSAREFIDSEFVDLSSKERAKIAAAVRKMREQARNLRKSGTYVPPASGSVTLEPQDPDKERAKRGAKEKRLVDARNAPNAPEDLAPRQTPISRKRTGAAVKATIAGEAMPEGVAKPSRKPRSTPRLAATPTFQDIVLGQLKSGPEGVKVTNAEEEQMKKFLGKKDVKDYYALKALREAGFKKPEVRRRAKLMGVSEATLKAAKSTGVLSLVAMALQHLGDKKQGR